MPDAAAEEPGSGGARITVNAITPRRMSLHARIRRSAIAASVVAYIAITAKSALLPVLFETLGVVVVLAGILTIVRMVDAIRRNVRGSYWVGLASFHEDCFPNASAFPDIVRTPRASLGRQGLSGGRLRIEHNAAVWRAGSMFTPRCEISGSFHLPWTRVDHVDISRIPFKLNFLGGAITVTLIDGSVVDGEFLGSRRRLLSALHRTSLASRRQPEEAGRRGRPRQDGWRPGSSVDASP